jgi:hypothetical protein
MTYWISLVSLKLPGRLLILLRRQPAQHIAYIFYGKHRSSIYFAAMKDEVEMRFRITNRNCALLSFIVRNK